MIDVYKIIQSIDRRKIHALRGKVVRIMIYYWLCDYYDPLFCELIEPSVTIIKDKFVCLLCGRRFKNYKSIFYHITSSHADVVDSIIFSYISKKYQYIGD